MLALNVANNRLLTTVRAMDSDSMAAPSLLPDWSRGHVVAHLALNADGAAGAIEGAVRGDSVPMYASDEQRSADIEELAGASPQALFNRLSAATERLDQAYSHVGHDRWRGRIPRTPGGAEFELEEMPSARLREVQIHHADLGLAYTHQRWPVEFVLTLLDEVSLDHAAARPEHAASVPFGIHAIDADRDWLVAAKGSDPETIVSGGCADLAWWLIGRGDGEGLESSVGPLPTLGPWIRSMRTPER